MNSGSIYLYIGLLMDAVSLILDKFKVSVYITLTMGIISIILIIYGVYRVIKYDKLIEKGRKIREKKKKE